MGDVIFSCRACAAKDSEIQFLRDLLKTSRPIIRATPEQVPEQGEMPERPGPSMPRDPMLYKPGMFNRSTMDYDEMPENEEADADLPPTLEEMQRALHAKEQ